METCRTCAKCDFENGNSNHWLDLFHPTCWQNEMAQVRLEIVNWKLNISLNDGLPQKICIDCFTKFCSIYTFRMECYNAQLELANIFDKIDANSLGENVEEDEFQTDQKSVTTTTKVTENFSISPVIANINHMQTVTPIQISKQSYVEKADEVFLYNEDESGLNTPIYANKLELQQSYDCSECLACFPDKASLAIHMNSHSTDHCGFEGKQCDDQLKNNSEIRFECNICQKRFLKQKTLKSHIRVHDPKRQFKCSHENCERLFLSRRCLTIHEATHTRKEEQCNFCNKSFRQPKALRCHIHEHRASVNPSKLLDRTTQLWVRHDSLISTTPFIGGMGMTLLQKMGWKPGEGLGPRKTGLLQPLQLDINLNKRGLGLHKSIKKRQLPSQTIVASNNVNASSFPAKNIGQYKHPVCFLNELATKNKWMAPQYNLQSDIGPPHCPSFLFSVEVNGKSYIPEQASKSKKEARLNAAKLCLQDLGILPAS